VKLFRIRGGVHPDYRKERTRENPIIALPMPRILCLPLKQHVGAAAKAVVTSGKRVKKGELLARASGAVSAPIHAPTSGYVVDIVDQTAPHPSGLPQKTIMLRSDGKDEWGELPGSRIRSPRTPAKSTRGLPPPGSLAWAARRFPRRSSWACGSARPWTR